MAAIYSITIDGETRFECRAHISGQPQKQGRPPKQFEFEGATWHYEGSAVCAKCAG